MGLQSVTGAYRGLHRVTRGHKGLQRVTDCCVVTVGCKG